MKVLTRVVSHTLTAPVEPVYNIEVEGSHCYRVSESGVLVHNMSTPASSSSPTPSSVTVNWDHILGEVAPTGSGTGGHYKNPRIRMDSIVTGPNADGVYVARISVQDASGTWHAKPGISTMWPDSWPEAMIEQVIQEAFIDAGPPTAGGRWFGRSCSGFKVTGWPKNPTKPMYDVYSAWPDI